MTRRRNYHRYGPLRRSIAPTTAAFITVLIAIGAVTRYLGVDAGLLALVLAVVALVAAPRIYLPIVRHSSDEDPRSDRTAT